MEKIQRWRKFSYGENLAVEKTQLWRKFSCGENLAVEKIQLQDKIWQWPGNRAAVIILHTIEHGFAAERGCTEREKCLLHTV